jgi:hypothetical protein
MRLDTRQDPPASERKTSPAAQGGRTTRRVETGYGDVAGLVVQRGEQPAQGGERVGHRPAVQAGVHGALEHPHLDEQVDQPAQAGREGRHVDGGVRRVGDDDDVGAQQVAVLGEQRRQRRGADLLLALDEQHHADRRAAAERAQHGEVHEHAGLVVAAPRP